LETVGEFRSVEFARPITVPSEGKRAIRIAALARGRDEIDVVVRSDETAFQVDHFRATCRVGPAEVEAGRKALLEEEIALDPAVLYEGILFQRGRFRRLRRYLRLEARRCVAEVAIGAGDGWFGAYLPGSLLLRDPGARDAFIHAVQACVPHDRLVPVGVERIVILASPEAVAQVSARERSREDDTFVYDLEVRDEHGRLCERWDGLTLRRVGEIRAPEEWPPALLAPYLERRLAEVLPGAELSVAVVCDGGDRRARSDAAIARAAGLDVRVVRRPDGKPEVAAELDVSAAHLNGTTVAVAGPAPVGCDLEDVAPRAEELWRDLLGSNRLALAELLHTEAGEELDVSATRVWAATECLRKTGLGLRAPLVAARQTGDGWVVVRAGDLEIATFAARVQSVDHPVAFGFLAGTGAR
jgi:enediyne polyketide synthase